MASTVSGTSSTSASSLYPSTQSGDPSPSAPSAGVTSSENNDEQVPNVTIIHVNDTQGQSTERRASSVQLRLFSGDQGFNNSDAITLNMKTEVIDIPKEQRDQLMVNIKKIEKCERDKEIAQIKEDTTCCYFSERLGCIISNSGRTICALGFMVIGVIIGVICVNIYV